MNNLTNLEAKEITLRYLINLYGKKKGAAIFAENQNNLFDYHGLAWSLGKECFPYFCQVFLHGLLFDSANNCVPLSKTHYELWQEMQDTMLNHNDTRNCYIFPRSFGKSSVLCLPLLLWSALYYFHPYNAICCGVQRLADAAIVTIKSVLEDNHLIDMCFGEILKKGLKYNASEIELDVKPNRSKIEAFSATSNLRGQNFGGKRFGLLILDDFQSDEDTQTAERRQAIWDKLNNDALKGLQNNNNHVIAVGTVQHLECLYSRLLNDPTWMSRIEKCILVDDIDEYFDNNEHWQKCFAIMRTKNAGNNRAIYEAEDYYLEHKAEMDFPLLWKDNYNCFSLAKEYYSDVTSFKQERQCDVRNLGQKRIRELTSISAEKMEEQNFTRTILSVDPAATTKKKSDFSAFCVLSETGDSVVDDTNPNKYISLKYARKCIIDKLEFDDYIDKIVDLLLTYPDINTVSIEKQTYMGADVIRLNERLMQHPALRGRTINIINKSRSKAKDARINAIIPDLNLGRIIFNDDDYEAMKQIKEFAGTAFTEHDDMIDAVADAVENISECYKPIPVMKVLNTNIWGL